MKMKVVLGAMALVIGLSSCSSTMKTMREPNSRTEFQKEDWTFSNQVSAEASSTKILNIDWSRLFNSEGGSVEGGGALALPALPIVGDFISDKTASYALWNLMQANPGYDVIFYPQFETRVSKPILGLGFLLKTTNVKTTARLAKIK